MIKFGFKYVVPGNKFIFDGVVYTKTNHERGFYYENGKAIFKTFKKKTIVETHQKKWDTDK